MFHFIFALRDAKRYHDAKRKILEGGAADGFNLVLLLGAGEQDADGELVGTGGVVGEFRHRHIVAIADFEIVLLEADLEDESVGIFDTIAEPDTNEEGHPVEVETIVEIVETSLILIDKVRRKDGGAETQRGSSASLFGDIDKGTDIAGEFHGELGDAIEAIGGLGEVSCGESCIP